MNYFILFFFNEMMDNLYKYYIDNNNNDKFILNFENFFSPNK